MPMRMIFRMGRRRTWGGPDPRQREQRSYARTAGSFFVLHETRLCSAAIQI